MISKKMTDQFNQQINEELYSSYLYLSMAAHFQAENLDGMAAWMKVQADEERDHGMKMFHHLNERGGKVRLAGIDAPKLTWASPLAAFTDAQKHERHISERIDTMMKAAISENDYASQAFLQWFVTEQVEEESHASAIVEKLKMVGDSQNGMFMVDRVLAKRGAK